MSIYQIQWSAPVHSLWHITTFHLDLLHLLQGSGLHTRCIFLFNVFFFSQSYTINPTIWYLGKWVSRSFSPSPCTFPINICMTCIKYIMTLISASCNKTENPRKSIFQHLQIMYYSLISLFKIIYDMKKSKFCCSLQTM